MTILDETWQCVCFDRAHKRTLLQLARDCGLRTAPAPWGHADDGDLFLNQWGGTVGIGALPKRLGIERPTFLIQGAAFEVLCLEYATTRHSTPPLLIPTA